MSRLTLRFRDREAESRYLSSTESMRRLQMRMALLFVGVLYCMVSGLDLVFMPASVRHVSAVMHLAQGIWLCLFALALFRSRSQRLHEVVVIAAVFIAWNLNLAISTMGHTSLLFGEAYLMLIWVWMISGVSLIQAAAVNLVFIAILEAVVFTASPFTIPQMVSHQFFILCAVVLGALGAYLTEYYKRQHFIGLRQVSEHAAALAKLSQAVEQSGEAILITDRQAIIEYANPTFTRMTGNRPEEVIGMTPAVLKQDAGDPFSSHEMWVTLARGEVWNGMFTEHRRDGSAYPALISVAPIHDGGGNVTHYVVTQKDMTEHQRLEGQLRHAQKMEAIGTLVGGIAHDFNNTLAGITGNIYLAKHSRALPRETVEVLERIESLAFRSANIVKQLLAFSRKGIIQMLEMPLMPFMAEVSKLYAVTLPENIGFRCDCQVDEPMAIHGDAGQLEQAIFNLLNNARDAVAGVKDPRIVLGLERYVPTAAFREANPSVRGEVLACIQVSDNGCGIKSEQIAHIFEPFYTTKDVNEGTGLGLSMVYGTAQSHGGAVTVDSKPGRGTTIRLYLPLLAAENGMAEDAGEEALAEGSGATVLLADDNQAVLKIVQAVLERLGYKVIQATDGEQAVALYREHRAEIGLVILDVVMPRMGGIEASKAIRALDAEAKIMFMTGYDPSQQFNTEDMAAEEVVLKPFKVSALSQLVKSVLER